MTTTAGGAGQAARRTPPTVVIAGGGTGGHLFPGIALADALAARGLGVTFVGTAAGIEVRAVPAAGYSLRVLPGRQLRGGGVRRALAGIAATARGTLDGLRLLGELRPGLVVGVGGYASVAVVLAARLRRVPVLLLEQNVLPGAANRLLGRLARRVCVGFEESSARFPAGRAVHTGNPVRCQVLVAARRRRERTGGGVGVLVFGGSAGARRLNQTMVEAVRALGDRARALALVHQTGPADLDTVRAGYAAMGVGATVVPFIADMGGAYAAADLVVARAGAMTCAEVTAVGLPSILVPYPWAAGDHQRRNAEVLVRAGAARMILDRELTPGGLAAALGGLIDDGEARARMAARARGLGRPDAAERVVAECLRLLPAGDLARGP